MAKIFICGDILNDVSTTSFFDQNMTDVIRNSNYSICNFEAPIESSGQPIKKAGPHKKQKLETISILKNAGFDLLLLANNHIFDYGVDGLQKTLEEASMVDIETIGANLSFDLAYMPIEKEIAGIRFGLINVSELQFGTLISEDIHNYGYAWINHPYINNIIVSLKKRVDYVLVLAHAGMENYDIPMIEWRNRYKELCDLGADCVIASHPHIPQGYERYNTGLIFYSLGNFFFPNHKDSSKADYGYSIIIDFDINKKMDFEIVYHKVEDYRVIKIPKSKSQISFDILNKRLEVGNYEHEANNICLEFYNMYCYPYYASIFNAIIKTDNIVTIFKKILKQLFYKEHRKEEKELLLLHLNRNETYKYITQRALELKLFSK